MAEDADGPLRKRFFTVPEAAVELSLSRSATYRLIAHGHLRAKLFNGALRVARRDLSRYIAQSTLPVAALSSPVRRHRRAHRQKPRHS